LGDPTAFGVFTPQDYFASTTVTVWSTACDATLTVHDPSVVRNWSGPATSERVPMCRKQSITATEPLRTGRDAKTLTFTLSTAEP
jgi:hypothetical protein